MPRIIPWTGKKGRPEERLLILDHEPSGGRPIGTQYWDRNEKIKFMDQHGIDVSVVRCISCLLFLFFTNVARSTANPWLDFLPPVQAHQMAHELNDDLEEYCSTGPSVSSQVSLQRLYGFGLLPLVPEIHISQVLEAIKQISHAPHLKGLIMGTKGIGKGLDDDALDPVWAGIEEAGLVVFLHPHYGVDNNAWGEKDNGHVLPLALGFPFETTVVRCRSSAYPCVSC